MIETYLVRTGRKDIVLVGGSWMERYHHSWWELEGKKAS